MNARDEIKELRKLRAAQDRLRRARTDRDDVIRQAIKAGLTYRKVAEAVGLHVSHVHRIAHLFQARPPTYSRPAEEAEDG